MRINSFILTAILQGNYYDYPHVTDEEPKDQRGLVTRPRSYSQKVVESGF